MKKCKDCKIVKKKENFYANQGECKICSCNRIRSNRLKRIEYYKRYDFFRNKENYNLICLRKYSMMKQRVLGRGSHKSSSEGKFILTKQDFMDWCKINKKCFILLQKEWKKSNYNRALAPSIDRIDNKKGYSINNIQWLALRDNIKKDIDIQRLKNIKRGKDGRFMK